MAAKNRKAKPPAVFLHPFGREVAVLVGPSPRRSLVRYAKKFGVVPDDWAAEHPRLDAESLHDEERGVFAVSFTEGRVPVGTIVHECFRVMNRAADSMGDPICVATNECYAYALDRFVTDVVASLMAQGVDVTA